MPGRVIWRFSTLFVSIALEEAGVVLRNNKLLSVLLSLVAATVVSAAPTMCDCIKNCDCNKNFLAGAVSPTSDAHVHYVSETSQINQHFNSELAAIGAEILKPPPEFTDFSPIDTKTLPPVPAAFFMVLTGFLCVSLVKDRRVWLAALAGILWAGQAGFQAIPQLASNISKHIQQTSPSNIALMHRIEDLCRLRSDIEGTKYIGLLRHLAGIPAGTMSLPLPASLLSLQAPSPSLRAKRSNLNAPHEYFVSARAKLRRVVFSLCHRCPPNFPHHLGGASPTLHPAFICPASRAEQYICFSPAFIFARLARGPPNFT